MFQQALRHRAVSSCQVPGPNSRGGGGVVSRLISLHMKVTFKGKFTIFRNCLTLGGEVSLGSIRLQVSKHQKFRKKYKYLTKEDKQMANKYVKIYSMSLVIRSLI